MIYSEALQPVAKIDDVVGLIWATGARKTYKVLHVEPLPELVYDFGTIAAQSALTERQIEDLKMGDNWLSQLRMEVIDDIEVLLRQPKAVQKWSTAKAVFKASPYTKPDNLSEFFVFEEGVPFFLVSNPTKTEIALSRIRFKGFKYLLEEFPTEEKVIWIPIESRG